MVSAIVLAAGTSSRMHRPKQLLEYAGKPMLRHVLEILLSTKVDEVVVVLGHEAGRISPVIAGMPVRVVLNQAYADGMSGSVRLGLAAAARAGNSDTPRGVLFALADQPLVKPQTIDLLIDAYCRQGGITAPCYNGQRGNPVIFNESFFPEIMELSGDAGAREIIRRHPGAVVLVDVEDRGVLLDIDTWTEYCELT